MKKKLIIIILILIMISTYLMVKNNMIYDNDIGDILYTDIKAYINDNEIPVYIINGHIIVLVKNLNQYGFNIKWDETMDTIDINYEANQQITPIEVTKIDKTKRGQKFCDLVDSELNILAANKEIKGLNADGIIAIYFRDLSCFGRVTWNSKKRIVKLSL